MNLTPRWVEELKRAGHDALHWSAAGPSMASDREICGFAREHGYVVVTNLDFARILALTREAGPSVVLLRGEPLTPEARGAALIEALQTCAAELEKGAIVRPEIADYEVRRELLRAGRSAGLARLDALKSLLRFVPINSGAMLQAAEFWARARNAGRQSASDSSLDADVILAAQAAALKDRGEEPIVATTNVRHLVLFCSARLWNDIGHRGWGLIESERSG